MTPWEELERSRVRRRAGRRRTAAGVAGLLLLLLAAVVAIRSLLINPTNFSADTLTAQEPARRVPGEVVVDRSAPPVTGKSGTELGSTIPSMPYFSTDFAGDHLARLAFNLQDSTVPALVPTAGPVPSHRGPQRLEYTVSGSGQVHAYPVGIATVSQTDVVGAAGEWRVRPWWKPGWLTASADCGEVGTAAVAGHVSWAGRPGPFHDLGGMTAGDPIRCQSGDGRWFTYEVTEVVRIDYSETDYYWRSLEENTAELSLFTCTPEITGIIVVRARLAAD